MNNFTDFFAAAGGGGGGGFTKEKKYSSINSGAGFPNKIFSSISCQAIGFTASGSSTLTLGNFPATWFLTGRYADLIAGQTITTGGYTYTLGTNTAGSTQKFDNAGVTYNLTSNTTADVQGNQAVTINSVNTVNPANDLGLSDGDQLGYMLVGGGNYGESTGSYYGAGGRGGKILQGIATIGTASTDLVLSIGEGGVKRTYSWAVQETREPSESTITGGLTLSSASGIHALAGSNAQYQSTGAQFGVFGYGGGGGGGYYEAGNQREGGNHQGYGNGALLASHASSSDIYYWAGDGSIIFYY